MLLNSMTDNAQIIINEIGKLSKIILSKYIVGDEFADYMNCLQLASSNDAKNFFEVLKQNCKFRRDIIDVYEWIGMNHGWYFDEAYLNRYTDHVAFYELYFHENRHTTLFYKIVMDLKRYHLIERQKIKR